MKPSEFEKNTSKILSVISNPFRIKVLLAIGRGEACVCHLEALLKQRQAFISQHLMALRKAGILDTRREGKFIFYRLADSQTYDLIRIAGKLAGLEDDQIPELERPGLLPECCCPNCVGVDFDAITINASIDAQEK
jgi:DNA-binding transcriptional ArsR family regulator